MTIQKLSDQLASQIAAGEVVERPSSVVKELMENSIDAGATTINIDVRQGGRESIQIADNGQGIDAAEIETAFLRHATSKLQRVEDLNSIRTLGFRGEALAAIAAVSQVTIVSRAAGATAGTRLVLNGGIVQHQELVGAPQGTVIAVDNLFYNVPARLKFLKSAATEKRLIDEFVTRYALAYPHLRIRLTHNGRITFQSSGSGQVADVLVAIYGPEIARQLLEIEDSSVASEEPSGQLQPQATPISVSGFIGSPSVHFANRGQITLFVNGRWIKDTQLTYAVIQAYHTLLPSGRYPLGLIFMTLPPEDVDVNVHPTKTEVRFRQGKTPFGTVQRAVRQTLVADAPIRQMTAWGMGANAIGDSPGWMGTLNQQAFGGDSGAQGDLALGWLDETTEQVNGGEAGPSPSTPHNSEAGDSQLPIMRVVGQVGAAYIITEGPEGLFLIDQQAAHQRVLHEQLQAEWAGDGVVTQQLSTGTAVTLSPTQAEKLTQFQTAVANVGLQVEAFGPNTFMVREVPKLAASCDPARLLVAVVEVLEQSKGMVEEADLVTAVCQTVALRAGQSLTPPQMQQLIHNLEKCADPFTDPLGKPTFIYLSVAQLAREFGRI